VWEGNGSSGSWVHTSVTTAPTAGAWNHIRWSAHRVIGDTSCSGTECMYYDSLTLNGTVYALNLAEPAGPLPGGLDASTTGCQFQLDMVAAGTAAEYADQVNCSFTTAQSAVTAATYTITGSPTQTAVSGVVISGAKTN
jgi:hypothetical protein